MKLTELQKLLGEQIKELTENDKLTTFDIDKANAVSKMASQLINNASVILRANKRNDRNGIV